MKYRYKLRLLKKRIYTPIQYTVPPLRVLPWFTIRRILMDWREQVLAVLDHHDKRQKEHGIASNGRPKKGVPKGWSMRDTADELGLPLGTCSELLSVAREIRKGGLTSVINEKLARLKVKEQKQMSCITLPELQKEDKNGHSN